MYMSMFITDSNTSSCRGVSLNSIGNKVTDPRSNRCYRSYIVFQYFRNAHQMAVPAISDTLRTTPR